MTEKKATVKKTATKKAATTKTTTAKRTTTKKVEIAVSAENAGFRAGDVYQALAAAEKPMSVAEIAKAANISTEEVYLGTGWLLKEGKVKNEEYLITLA
ncbi:MULTISPECIES: winged helix-turn-helix domain-containing protein [Prevotella]|jgi:hypothetical protein|uniref:winged helix-turn-helix domain-containing protein n=1 Tax=Prevotella TaxID=838 RepID=UPI000D1026EE|nr:MULTISPECIES: winged helix-turn-helix domain-containing protein [Prevotella]MEE0669758.1 winged helix-turn-helix domain-containing protein [Prevotella sp.]